MVGKHTIVVANNVVQIQFRLVFLAICVVKDGFEDMVIVQFKADSRLVEAHRVWFKS